MGVHQSEGEELVKNWVSWLMPWCIIGARIRWYRCGRSEYDRMKLFTAILSNQEAELPPIHGQASLDLNGPV